MALTTAGTKFSVSPTIPDSLYDHDFAALTWTQVSEVNDIPEFGPSTSVNTFNPIDNRVTQKSTGSIDYGSVAIGFAHVEDDPGQVILAGKIADNTGLSCRVTRPDGTVDYFTGIVASFTREHGGVDSFFIGVARIEVQKTSLGPLVLISSGELGLDVILTRSTEATYWFA